MAGPADNAADNIALAAMIKEASLRISDRDARKARRNYALGLLGPCVRAVQSQPAVQLSDAAKQEARRLHPRGEPMPPGLAPLRDTVPMLADMDAEIIRQAARDMAKISDAAGPSGMTPTDLAHMLSSSTGVAALRAITAGLETGSLGPAAPPLRACRLLLLPKPGYNPARPGDVARLLRPIAIAEPIMRLICKLAIRQVPVQKALSPRQFALRSGGIEHNTSITRAALDEGLVALRLDISNAYNSLDRRTMMEKALANETLKPIHGLVRAGYHEPSSLFVKGPDGVIEDHLKSEQGVRQGDPLSTLLFCHTIDPCLEAIAGHVGVVQVIAYADDITILTLDNAAIADILTLARNLLSPLNLTVNVAKSGLHYFGDYVDTVKIAAIGAGIELDNLSDSFRALGALFINPHNDAKASDRVRHAGRHRLHPCKRTRV